MVNMQTKTSIGNNSGTDHEVVVEICAVIDDLNCHDQNLEENLFNL